MAALRVTTPVLAARFEPGPEPGSGRVLFEEPEYGVAPGQAAVVYQGARVLGDGLVANEPLPPQETTARTKQTTAAGLLVIFSVGWDLAAPHRPAESDRR